MIQRDTPRKRYRNNKNQGGGGQQKGERKHMEVNWIDDAGCTPISRMKTKGHTQTKQLSKGYQSDAPQ